MADKTQNLFAEIAVEKGLATLEQIEEARKVLEQVTQTGLKLSLAKVLVDRNILTQDQVKDLRREAVQRGGHLRLGKYEVIGKLGQGGMGAVYKARDVTLDRIVALKVLSQGLAGSQEYVTRFVREAKLACKINHPNAVTVYEIAKAGRYQYIAMEFVEGRELGERLKEGKPVPEREGLDIIRQVAGALMAAHREGIVHRDIKPSNILITADGVAKLADLGIAKLMVDDAGLTQSHSTMGSPRYMSPEQCRSAKRVDSRSDIYSLGATFYHMLTGSPPFDGDSSYEVMLQHERAPVPDISEVAAGTSEGTAALIRKMMAKKPEDRPESMRAVIEEIDRILAPAAPGAGLDFGSALAGLAASEDAQEASGPPPPRRQAYVSSRAGRSEKFPLVAAVTLLVVAALGYGVYSVARSGNGEVEPRPSTPGGQASLMTSSRVRPRTRETARPRPPARPEPPTTEPVEQRTQPTPVAVETTEPKTGGPVRTEPAANVPPEPSQPEPTPATTPAEEPPQGNRTTLRMKVFYREVGGLPVAFRRHDRNNDRELERSEVPYHLRPLFFRADKNHDGKITLKEFRNARKELQDEILPPPRHEMPGHEPPEPGSGRHPPPRRRR